MVKNLIAQFEREILEYYENNPTSFRTLTKSSRSEHLYVPIQVSRHTVPLLSLTHSKEQMRLIEYVQKHKVESLNDLRMDFRYRRWLAAEIANAMSTTVDDLLSKQLNSFRPLQIGAKNFHSKLMTAKSILCEKYAISNNLILLTGEGCCLDMSEICFQTFKIPELYDDRYYLMLKDVLVSAYSAPKLEIRQPQNSTAYDLFVHYKQGAIISDHEAVVTFSHPHTLST